MQQFMYDILRLVGAFWVVLILWCAMWCCMVLVDAMKIAREGQTELQNVKIPREIKDEFKDL